MLPQMVGELPLGIIIGRYDMKKSTVVVVVVDCGDGGSLSCQQQSFC